MRRLAPVCGTTRGSAPKSSSLRIRIRQPASELTFLCYSDYSIRQKNKAEISCQRYMQRTRKRAGSESIKKMIIEFRGKVALRRGDGIVGCQYWIAESQFVTPTVGLSHFGKRRWPYRASSPGQRPRSSLLRSLFLGHPGPVWPKRRRTG